MTGVSESRAKSIFEEALDLRGAERKAFLDGACAGDTALRARVEVLLAGAERDDLFLSDPALNTPPAPSPDQIGAWIGPYRIVRLIGEGGFGSVYLAHQDQPVSRDVALKIIKLGMDTRAVVARFEQERQALALMDHPNIAKVLEAGATATGRPYFVMELVEGVPITEFCDQAKLPIADRITLFNQVCSAVQHAHTKGVIHRDLKPGNVLVALQDGKPAAKVIDFGIAKAMDRPLTDKTVFTEQRTPIGTPEYMSPEQAEGSRDLDTRTDVYSLGVVLYELLSGLPPFDPQRLRSAAYAEIQRIIREVDPPKPSTRLSQAANTLASVAAQRAVEPARLGSLLRGELDWIVMRALDKDRARRYESPGSLSADLSRYLAGEAVQAAPPSRSYIARKFISRHRTPVFAASALLVAIILGAVGTSVEYVKARKNAADATSQAHRADLEAAQARTSASVAQSVNALMKTMIARADRGKEEGRANITVREVMDAAANELSSAAGAYDPGVASALAKSIGDTYRELSLFEPAVKMMRLHSDNEKSLHGPTSLEYASALGELGEVLKAKGAADEAASTYDQARSIAAALGEAGADTLAEIDDNRAALLAEQGNTDAAEAVLKQTLASCESRGKTTTVAYTAGLNNLATVNFQRGNLADAEKYFLQSVDIQRARGSQSGKELIETLHNLAGLQYMKRDYPAAEKNTREELALARRLYGDLNMNTAEALESLSIILTAKDDLQGAEQFERESIGIMRTVLDPDHAEIAVALHKLGSVLHSAGKLEEAETTLRQSCDLLDKKVSLADPDSVYTHYEVAFLMEKRGAYAQAEQSLRPSVAAAATSSTLKEGSRYEWMRHAANSLLGSLLVYQAADPATTPDLRSSRLKEAESLIAPAADRFLVIGAKMGPKTRAQIVPAALERAARLYDQLEKSDPNQGYAAKAAQWRDKAAEFEHPPAKDPK